jgi:hypothetical protein
METNRFKKKESKSGKKDIIPERREGTEKNKELL